jgi:hypothetical protein
MKMKKIIAAAVLVLLPSIASAECYESGAVFDGRGSYGEGTLCSFGGSDSAESVLPYYQERKTNPMDYLFSEREQLNMLKSVVTRRGTGNSSVLRQAVSSASRPLRPFRNMRGMLGTNF